MIQNSISSWNEQYKQWDASEKKKPENFDNTKYWLGGRWPRTHIIMPARCFAKSSKAEDYASTQ